MPKTHILSPLGWLEITGSGHAITAVSFGNEPGSVPPGPHPGKVLEEATDQLQEYFSGELTVFDLPLEPEGTSFQKKVWQALREIPYGTTISYLELAGKLGDKQAVRAAGRANGQNPIPIIIPCHRVIGADGSLTGYSGGIERKRRLLQHEGAILI